jgi:hypothetical protein
MNKTFTLGTAIAAGFAVSLPYTTRTPDGVGSDFAIIADVASNAAVGHLPENGGGEHAPLQGISILSTTGSNSSVSYFHI